MTDTNAVTNDIEKIVNEILKGIDETETGSIDGWWETSTGAEFGKRRKAELIAAIRAQAAELQAAHDRIFELEKYSDGQYQRLEALEAAVKEAREVISAAHDELESEGLDGGKTDRACIDWLAAFGETD